MALNCRIYRMLLFDHLAARLFIPWGFTLIAAGIAVWTRHHAEQIWLARHQFFRFLGWTGRDRRGILTAVDPKETCYAIAIERVLSAVSAD